jgi:hypothetical protein
MNNLQAKLPMRFVLPLLATAIAAHVSAAHAAPTPITLDQAMANPDWIGNPVESAWWGWDSRQIYFKQKRTGSAVRDTSSHRRRETGRRKTAGQSR